MTDDDDKQQADDTQIVVDTAEQQDQQAAPAKDEVEDTLAELRKQLDDEKARRIAAEQRASTLADSEHAARTEAQDSNYNLVVNAIDTLKAAQDNLKGQYAAAMEANDYAAAAEIQVSMADTASKLVQLEQGKQAMENAPKPEKQAVLPSDPVEALASQLTPRSADWVRRNPQYAKDERLYTKMIAAHNLAVADGLVPDSDAYFDAVETTLGHRKQAPTNVDTGTNDDPMSAAARPSSPPAAPVTRGNDSGNRVRLSSEEIEMAQMMGMTPEEYAKNKVSLQKEGKITTH